ncbi:uncharacterized protein LOC123874040 [Maniola jurtina]|uniref:uncharacterized protein LOC123874040 n=1 Tax=Maniola jurtina TaxID=191418 RepID=UPI001E68873E|nr:uncharacterized protein LOC123874040 [Maniola jurtina]
MAGLRMIFILPLFLVIAASTQADSLQCYQCEDCEAKEIYENSLKTCPLPAPAPKPAAKDVAEVTGEENTKPIVEENKVTDNVVDKKTEAPTNTAADAVTEVNRKVEKETNAAEGKAVKEETNVETVAKVDPATTKQVDATMNTEKSSRRRRATAAEPKIAKCVKVVFEDGEKTRINRGCSYEIQSVDDKTRCATQNKDTAKLDLIDCQVCEEDNCNSAMKFTVASIPIVMGLVLNFV